jgi:cytochrome c oxidase assembly protein subunit 11
MENESKNKKILLLVFGVVFTMMCVTFASVPLYDLFCRVTGFGGTTQIATQFPDEILERQITVKFNANISDDLPWKFEPEQREVSTKLGEQTLVAYRAQNNAKEPTMGTAMYNVTPTKAGKYFQKIECFCFDEQVLKPGERVSMPVMFYVDPKMALDKNLDDVNNITLSYTFYKAESEALEQALEEFYNQPSDTNDSSLPLTE